MKAKKHKTTGIDTRETDKVKEIKTHVFPQGRYYIVVDKNLKNCRGSCEEPAAKRKTIRVKEGLKGEELLNVLIDESTHATWWALENDAVSAFSDSLSHYLWKLGYRLVLKD